jgi:polyisoprenyl-teichoic acid--peptidoglycan teichoic acid transferase
MKKKKRATLVPLFFILMIMTMFVGVFYAVGYSWRVISALNKTEYISRTEPFNINERMNILLLAVDAPTLQEPSRSDTIKVISLEPDGPSMSMMTIPRDSYVVPAGFDRSRSDNWVKINAINNTLVNPRHFGTDKLVETVGDLLGIDIDGYVKINYKGFIDVIDSMGGIDFYVDYPMDYVDSVDGYEIHLKKGLQHLDGESALQYVRFRSGPGADWASYNGKVIGRSARQTKFIKAVIKELAKPSNWNKIPSAVEAVMSNVQTNIPVGQTFSFVEILRKLDFNSIEDIPFPGVPSYVTIHDRILGEFNMSVVKVDFTELKDLGQEHFSD